MGSSVVVKESRAIIDPALNFKIKITESPLDLLNCKAIIYCSLVPIRIIGMQDK